MEAKSLRARTELTVALAESGRWQETSRHLMNWTNITVMKSIVLETAEYLASKAIQEGQQIYAAKWYEYMSEAGNPRGRHGSWDFCAWPGSRWTTTTPKTR